MSSHPNVILMTVLTPDDGSNKTMRGIKKHSPSKSEEDYEVCVGENDYTIEIMESDYNDSHQIEAEEGDLIVFDLITYGYGEKIEWDTLEKLKNELETWSKEICEKFKCSYKIYVSANYW